MSFKYIDRVGIELEGAWRRGHVPPGCKKEESIHIKHKCGDLSRDPDACSCSQNSAFKRVNEKPTPGDWDEKEAVSPPLQPDDIKKWLNSNYPEVSNRTCGMHVHVSFKSQGSYLKLMDRKFHDYFIAYFKSRATIDKSIGTDFFFQRLAGKNKFCTDAFRPAEQVEVTVGTNNPIRYSMLNYCWKLHNTLECRVFPMYPNAMVAEKAIYMWLNCVEDYLDTVKGVVIREEFEDKVIIDFPLCSL